LGLREGRCIAETARGLSGPEGRTSCCYQVLKDVLYVADFLKHRLYRNASESILSILQTENVTFNNHFWCITDQVLRCMWARVWTRREISLMSVPCSAWLGITDQHYALIIIPLFITQAPTCYGTHVPSSGSILYPCELLESPKWLCHRDVPLYRKCWWPVCTGCCSFTHYFVQLRSVHSVGLLYPVGERLLLIAALLNSTTFTVLFGNTAHSESRCALRLRYVHLVASIEDAIAVCCCFTVFTVSLAYLRETKSPTPGFNKMALLCTQLTALWNFWMGFSRKRGISRNVWSSRLLDLNPSDF
jgi:hypothetical protein